jgi:hypothetical protein
VDVHGDDVVQAADGANKQGKSEGDGDVAGELRGW